MFKKIFVPILFLCLLLSFVIFRSSLEAENSEVQDTRTEASPAIDREAELKSVEEKIKKEELRLSTSKSMLPLKNGESLKSLLKRKEELQKEKK